MFGVVLVGFWVWMLKEYEKIEEVKAEMDILEIERGNSSHLILEVFFATKN